MTHRTRAQRRDTTRFALVFVMVLSMMLGLVPSLAWAEITEDWQEVGEQISDQLTPPATESDATRNPDGTYTKNNITYDGHITSVSVVVADNNDGTLSATATYAGGSATFTNTYTPPSTPPSGRTPQTGDYTPVGLTFGLLAVGAIVVVGGILVRRGGLGASAVGSHKRGRRRDDDVPDTTPAPKGKHARR
jgi:hypothetical protein